MITFSFSHSTFYKHNVPIYNVISDHSIGNTQGDPQERNIINFKNAKAIPHSFLSKIHEWGHNKTPSFINVSQKNISGCNNGGVHSLISRSNGDVIFIPTDQTPIDVPGEGRERICHYITTVDNDCLSVGRKVGGIISRCNYGYLRNRRSCITRGERCQMSQVTSK